MSASENKEILNKIRTTIRSLDRDGDTPILSKNPDAAKFRYVSIPTGEAKAIKSLVMKEKASSSIEIGLAYGFSALAICEGLVMNNSLKCRHTIIDPWQSQDEGYAKCGLEILSEAGLDPIIEFYPEKSQIVLPRFLSENKKFDFGFVDGNHLFDYVFVDLFYLGHLIEPGAIIFLDDYDYPGIKSASSFFIKNLDWRIEDINSDKDHEWAVIRTAKSDDKRHFKYFVGF